jgi:hypothetical protein
MTGRPENRSGARNRWRTAAWGVALLIVLLPLFAMQYTDKVDWSPADFAVAGALILGAGLAYELTVKMTGNAAYRTAVGIGLAGALILIWLNLAVGIIGTENNPANLMYGGVLAVAVMGALIARFQSKGMAGAMVATALAQILVAAIALMAGMQSPISPAIEILGLTGFFVALWLISAWLFRNAAVEQVPAGGC